MNRRELLLGAGSLAIGFGLSRLPIVVADDIKPKKILFFSKSSGFEHAVIKRTDGQPSFVEKILSDLGPKIGIEFTFSKDGSLFSKDYLSQFDAFMFYTTGYLLAPGKDGNPPMSEEGKAAFLDAIKQGKGFIGLHSAADTFHTGETDKTETAGPRASRHHNPGDKADPYVRMIGAEFIIHGAQQQATMRVIDTKFPGFEKKSDHFELMEEWYSLIDFSHDLHVLMVQDTKGMNGVMYQRPPYPATWARMHGKGRVFYTSMGHREDVWTNPLYQEMLIGALSWSTGKVDADVTPNIETVAPNCWTPPPVGPPATAKSGKSKPATVP